MKPEAERIYRNFEYVTLWDLYSNRATEEEVQAELEKLQFMKEYINDVVEKK